MSKIDQLNVFIASPGDVAEERDIVSAVCEDLSKRAICKGKVTLLVSRWEDIRPQPGEPQEIINNKFVKECDLLIGILHKRFGSPTLREESGTIEEFNLAYDLWKKQKKPDIMFYFKDAGKVGFKEMEELTKVLEFQQEIIDEHKLLFKQFGTPENFKEELARHLEEWIVEYAKKPEKSPIRQKEIVELPPSALEIPETYKEWVIRNCQNMDVGRLVESGKEKVFQIGLPKIFIPLYANPPNTKCGKLKFGKEKYGPRNIEDLAAENSYLLVEGQAASGKTTLLKHLAYSIVQKEHGKGLDDYLPVLVFLKDLQKIVNNKKELIPGKVAAEEFLEKYLLTSSGLDIRTVDSFCKANKAIFLIDGLDEIDSKTRKIVVDSLAAFQIHHPCIMVLSGRPHGMDDSVINQFGDMRVEINRLNNEQIAKFIRNWFKYIYNQESKIGDKTVSEVIGDITAHPSIEKLRENPLMLTAICIIYHVGGRLPDQRAELYKRFVDNLIYKKFEDPERVNNFLMALAFKVHQTGKRGFSKTFAVKVIENIYAKKENETPVDYKQELKNKFDNIEQNCGLLKFEKGQYDFWHLTFQEFLAGRYIAEQETDYANVIKDFWDNDWYRETIELFVGYLSIQSKAWANKIVENKLDENEKSPFKHWCLAAKSLLDIHEDNRDDLVLEKARKRLLEIFRKEREPKVLADAGEILGWLGDPRKLEEFIEIKGGEYELKELDIVKNIKSFEIGKYPVTNQWYKKFIDDKGYITEEYWSPEGWKWRSNKVEYPRYWHERKWKCPNAPVVGVSWYEAYAFCRWLTETRKDRVYRLPTEEEWEAAAAGKEGRNYAWGNTWQKDWCNSNHAKIRKTSSVGIFLKGCTPEGLVDLIGNVWELTNTPYNRKENCCNDFKMNLELSDEQDQDPVFRGGFAWDGIPDSYSNNCGCRVGGYPELRNFFIGFRCVRTCVQLKAGVFSES